MREARVFWHGHQVGTLQVPDSYRPPITQAELDRIPAMLIGRSRSWLFDVRPGDLRLELRRVCGRDEVVVVASEKLGPGDVGCLVSFTAENTDDICKPDEEMIDLAEQVAHDLASVRRSARG